MRRLSLKTMPCHTQHHLSEGLGQLALYEYAAVPQAAPTFLGVIRLDAVCDPEKDVVPLGNLKPRL